MTPFSFVPQKYLVYLILAIVLIGGPAWWAYEKGISKYEAAIAAYKTQVTDLNKKLADADANIKVQIVTQYKTKIVHIKDVGDHNANVAKTIVPSACNLSAGWVSTHDSAATGVKVDPTAGSNAADSGIKDTEALATVSDNYDTFHKQKAELDALQDYINKKNAAIDAANAQVKKKHWWSK